MHSLQNLQYWDERRNSDSTVRLATLRCKILKQAPVHASGPDSQSDRSIWTVHLNGWCFWRSLEGQFVKKHQPSGRTVWKDRLDGPSGPLVCSGLYAQKLRMTQL